VLTIIVLVDMGLISEANRLRVKKLFDKELVDPVKVIHFTQDFECDYCKDTRVLLEELVELSSGKIGLEVYEFVKDAVKAKEHSVEYIPATIIGNRSDGVRYYGIPSGYEFSSLLEDLVDVSRGATRLADTTKQRLKVIEKPVHIKVFVTPTCPYCPRAVRIAHQFALENPNIRADMIESIEFPQLAIRYEVMAVPKVVINDAVTFEGALPEAQFLEHVISAVSGSVQE
jgi:glutaredoxin-like protein